MGDPRLTTCLSFDTEGEEAANFYCSIFPNSRIGSVTRYGDAGPGTPGSVMVVEFELDGSRFIALNGGPHGFNAAISFMVPCDTQEEIDHYWSRLTDGGAEVQCGWLTDRFGVSWQVYPRVLPELIADPDPERSQRTMRAMFEMRKLDLAALQRAHAGDVPATAGG